MQEKNEQQSLAASLLESSPPCVPDDPKKALSKIQSDLARRNWAGACSWLKSLEERESFMPEDMRRQVLASAAAKGARAWAETGPQRDFFDHVEKSPFWSGALLSWLQRKNAEVPLGQSPQMLRYLARAMEPIDAEEQGQIWFRSALTGAKMASPGAVWSALRELLPDGGFSEGQKRAILKSWVHGAMSAPLLPAKAHFPSTLNALESLGFSHEAGYLNLVTSVLKDLPPPSAEPHPREASAAFVVQELIERFPEGKAKEICVRGRYWLELTQWRAQASEENWYAWTPVEKLIQAQIKKAQTLAFPPAAVGALASMSQKSIALAPFPARPPLASSVAKDGAQEPHPKKMSP